ncbi:uncharacterized protein VTP21DRAFT_554 [Calcarisporiella thermophila]|uniref:uncharacterized protein n=1 Tax=Calcarisporiella thermophila TaxID=911321 RepID=UPI0037447176
MTLESSPPGGSSLHARDHHIYDSSAATSRASSPGWDNGEEEEHEFGSKVKGKKQVTYKVNGMNILNRHEVDSKTTMERLLRRRENHNHIERRRRDNINSLIMEIGELISTSVHSESKPKQSKGATLRMAVEYIRELQRENLALRKEIEVQGGCASMVDVAMQDSGNNRNSSEKKLLSPPFAASIVERYGHFSAPNSPRLLFERMNLSQSTPTSPRWQTLQQAYNSSGVSHGEPAEMMLPPVMANTSSEMQAQMIPPGGTHVGVGGGEGRPLLLLAAAAAAADTSRVSFNTSPPGGNVSSTSGIARRQPPPPPKFYGEGANGMMES